MSKYLNYSLLFLLYITLSAQHYSQKQLTLRVKVTDLRSAKGSLLIGLYKDQATFSKQKPYLSRKIEKSKLRNGGVNFTLSLPIGTYGVTLLDDENGNGKCDYGFFLPKEGFGFSDYYHRGLSSPTFDDFGFRLLKDDQSVVVKVKYM